MSEIKVGQYYKSARGTVIKIIDIEVLDETKRAADVEFITIDKEDNVKMGIALGEDMRTVRGFRVLGGIVDFELMDNFVFLGAKVFECDNPPVNIEEMGVIIAAHEKECVVDYGKDGSGFVVYDSDNFHKLQPYPLCFIEDNPVYAGDTVYYANDGEECIAQEYIAETAVLAAKLRVKSKSHGMCSEDIFDLTTRPLKKPIRFVKWVNIYVDGEKQWLSKLYDNRKDAYKNRARQNYITTSSVVWVQ